MSASQHNQNIKISRQVRYINNKLNTFSTCKISDKIQTGKINQISTPIVKYILDNKFDNGSDMDAVVCLFDNLFLATAKSRKDGLFHLSVHVSKWVKKLTQIDTVSSAGFVYVSDIISDIEVIIKIPRYIEEYDDMVREYFVGVTEINKLRHIIPTFVYTFGSFICPISPYGKLCNPSPKKPKIPFVIFEKIPGDSMKKMLSNDKITFGEYLGMFIQILLSLEVAQRNISFCHFDFHTENLMCRTISKDCKYTVPMDNHMYEITAKKYLPVIIDFGLSTVKNGKTVVGSYTFPQHGMTHYMLQGVDMFKFLLYSCLYSNGDIQRQIFNLLLFYGQDDPYKILIGGEHALDEAIDEYAKKGSYSHVTTQTPLSFLNWILTNPEYKEITSNYIIKKERHLFVPLSFSTTIQTYDNIFQHPEKGREDAIKLIDSCIMGNTSYIIGKYAYFVLNGYNKKLSSQKLHVHTVKIKDEIRKNRNAMIKHDLKMLFGYSKIKIPDILRIKDDSSRILNIKINSKKLKTNKKDVLKLINRYFNNITFFHDILPYLQFLYTIREIKVEKIYKKFLDSFLSSEHYKIYIQNNILIDRTYRWCHSLLDSIE